jgi:spermidine synthase
MSRARPQPFDLTYCFSTKEGLDVEDIKIRHGISSDGAWLTDAWGEHLLWTIGINDVLLDKKSRYQRVQVVDTKGLGRLLILDGNPQAAEKDEAGYHEMIVHPALCRMGLGEEKKSVLIIGGGDGGAAREALRHPDVERVDLVDIDGDVLDAAREYLPTMWRSPRGGTLDEDDRFVAHTRDGIAFLEEGEQSYDLIVVDASDPVGPGTVLYSEAFYMSLKHRLKEGGAVCVQAGSWFYLPGVLQTVRKGLEAVFPLVKPLQCFTAIYPGGMWNLCLATLGDDPVDVDEDRAKALEGTKFYDVWNHRAAFALPPAAREAYAQEPPDLERVSGNVQKLMG